MTTPAPTLPPEYAAWEPELASLAADLVGAIVPLSERLGAALGPLKPQVSFSADEPNGYAALARRGPYDRLLLSEWAIQLEHQDEFVRRASSGEHLFVELERRSPRVSLEAWALFDTGPDQLGAPRIGQLATLIALHRRAREADVRLKWAPAWHWERAPLDSLGEASVHTWLHARTAQRLTTNVLDAWHTVHFEAAPRTTRREVWLVGGESAQALARARGFGSIRLDDTDTSLEAHVWAPGARRAQVISLPLPAMNARVRLLRHPFFTPSAPTLRRQSVNKRKAVIAHPTSEIRFSSFSHRLLIRTESGSVAAMPVPNSARAGYGHIAVARLYSGWSLLAANWTGRHDLPLMLLDDRQQPRAANWNGAHAAAAGAWGQRRFEPRPRDLALSTATPKGIIEHHQRLFSHTGEDTAPDGLILGPVLVTLSRGPWAVHTSNSTLSLSTPAFAGSCHATYDGTWASFAWYSHGRFEFARTRVGDRVDDLAHAPFSNDAIARSLEHKEIIGLVRRTEVSPDFFRGLDVLVLAEDRCSVLRLNLQTESFTQLCRARAPIESCSVAPSGQYLAWRDANGEVAIFTMQRLEIVLRVRVEDLANEVP